MSLEKALEANTAAVLALTEALSQFTPGEVVSTTLSDPEDQYVFDPAPAPKKQDAKVSAPSKAKPAPSAPAPASTEAKAPAATSTSLTYDDIKKPFLELAKRDLAAAQALIAEFGFKTLKDAKPEQYAEILAKLNAMSEEGMA